MVEIGGKQYQMVELSARKYQSMVDGLNSEFGEDWQQKSGIDLKVGIVMVAGSLRAEDGSNPDPDALWDMPIRQIKDLVKQAMEINGSNPEAQASIEKN